MADSVGRLIAADQIVEAREFLHSSIAQEDTTAEEHYLLGRLSNNGERARAQFRRALETADSPDALAQPLISLLEYHSAEDNCNEGLRFCDLYMDRCRESRHYSLLINLRCRLALACDVDCRAEKELKAVLKESSDPDLNASVLLTLGDLATRRKKHDDAIRYFRKVADNPDNRYAGIALPRLSKAYSLAGNKDASRSVDRLYSSRYSTVRNEEVLTDKTVAAREAPLRESKKKSQARPSRASHYAVRVGTFTKPENAQRLQERFSSDGYTARVNVVDINGRKYYVVDVGRCESKSEAQALRVKLEAKNQERYLLVTVRDE